MKMAKRFKMSKPEIEAEIYYLTSAEGGRQSPVFNAYRGQFYYDGRDWDAPQEFIDKDMCELGEKVKVRMQTTSPNFHVGRFWVGKEFEIREGSTVVGNGKITKVIRDDFNYWEYESILNNLSKNCIPYDDENVAEFVIDFENYLGILTEIKNVDCKINLSNLKEMIVVRCELTKGNSSQRLIIDDVCKCWREDLAFSTFKYKTIMNSNERKFSLSFITWHSMYLTGKILIDFN